MKLILLLSYLLQLVQAFGEAPISPYGTLCLGILGNIYQFNTNNCTNGEYGTKCYCKDPRFVQTSVNCVEQYLQNVTESERLKMRDASYATIVGTCSNVNVTELSNLVNASLPVYNGRDSGQKPGTWPVYYAFQLTTQELWDALVSYKLSATTYPASKRYGSSLLGYWAGIFLIKGILHLINMGLPSISLKAGNSLLGRFYRRYFQIYCFRYTLITATQLCIVLGFVTLLSCVTFLDLRYHYPNYYFNYRDMSTYGAALGARTGSLALYILPLLTLFAGRNNFLQWLTGWTQEPFLVFHRWVARGEVALILAHAIAYSLGFAGVGYYSKLWSYTYWRWGIVALAFGMLIVVQACRFLRRFAYETFLVIHIISAIMFMVGGYYHLKHLQYIVDLNFFYATFAVWGFDRFMRLARMVFAGVHEATMVLEDENMLVITLKRPRFWTSRNSPGSYVFVHFMTPLMFWQSHPLTLTASTSDHNTIRLYFRVYSGISKHLAKRAVNTGEKGAKIKVMLDGPYGIKHNMSKYDECTFVAGGSGITAPLAYLQNTNSTAENLQKTTLHWAVPDEAALYWFREELSFLQNKVNCDVHVYISSCASTASVSSGSEKEDQEKVTIKTSTSDGDNSSNGCTYTVHGKLDIETVLESQIINTTGSMGVMCCGPTGLHVSTRNTISRNLHRSPYYIEYYEEAYTW